MSYLVTGSAGFIGGALVRRLREEGATVITVDKYGSDEYGIHLRDLFRRWGEIKRDIKFVFHLGANTDTLEHDKKVFEYYNVGYSKSLWYNCMKYNIPMIYASSAATYGDGSAGYSDLSHPDKLTPLNEYGHSKNDFDKFILSHKETNEVPFWAGLKFFNVYGYSESHKGKMASMVYHGYKQAKETGKIRLFENGHHERDFVYVEDLIDIMLWLAQKRPKSGLYNIGTGHARTFNDLALSVFNALNLKPEIEYFPMPESVKNQYQAFTEAKINKLRAAGYIAQFTNLEEGVKKYIKQLENVR